MLSDVSRKYIDETFSKYKEVEEPIEIVNKRCVIHMYPKTDTTPDDDIVDGYVDAFNCEVHVYDVEKKIKYISECHDDIQIDKRCGVRIFKDGSTMITIDGGVRIYYYHSIDIRSK